MYGTRDAALDWECEIRGSLEDMGFKCGKASTCIFRHDTDDCTAAVHGDDILMEGDEKAVRVLYARTAKKYECKMNVIGAARHLDKELKILNRTVHWTPRGIAIEADKRHVAEIIKEVNCDANHERPTEHEKEDACKEEMEAFPIEERKDRGRCMAAHAKKAKEEAAEADPMDEEEATRFRGVAARVNYLSQDRINLKMSSLKMSRHMSRPKKEDWK